MIDDQDMCDYVERNINHMLTKHHIILDRIDIINWTWMRHVRVCVKLYLMDKYMMEADLADYTAEQFVKNHEDYLKDLYNFERI